jgi:hypothetical protein
MTLDQLYVGMPVRIKDDAPLFPGMKATVIYIGTCGASVGLFNAGFTEPVPLEVNEMEEDNEPREMFE